MKKIVLSLALAAMACGVPKSQYDALQAQEQKEKTDSDKEIADLKAKITELEGKSGQLDEQTKKELEELRAQKAQAEARAKLFDDFVQKFKSMIDAGKLDIATRHGRIVLALATDVLFDEGKTEIKPEGKTAVTEVANALKGVTGRHFQVAGHTDTFPIHNKEFPSNWELSTARAVAVVKLLVEKGVKADQLSAAGYAEFESFAEQRVGQGALEEPAHRDRARAEHRGAREIPELKPVEHATPPPAATTATPVVPTTRPPTKPPTTKKK